MAQLADVIDAIHGTFKAAWDNIGDVVGDPGPFDAVYTMIDGDGEPNGGAGKIWARLTVLHAAGRNTSIGSRRYQHAGTIRIEVFVPATKSDASTKANEIAQALLNAYIYDDNDDITYSDVRFDDKPATGTYRRQDVVGSFTWAQFRS